MKLTESVHLYLDSARGQYIPRDFARDTKRNCILNVSDEDIEYLKRGPGGCMDEPDLPLLEGESVLGEHYWDVWQTVLDNAILAEPDGPRFKLWNGECGDIFLVPEHWEWNEQTEGFEKPQLETEEA